jgi:hypothetical protein
MATICGVTWKQIMRKLSLRFFRETIRERERQGGELGERGSRHATTCCGRTSSGLGLSSGQGANEQGSAICVVVSKRGVRGTVERLWSKEGSGSA